MHGVHARWRCTYGNVFGGCWHALLPAPVSCDGMQRLTAPRARAHYVSVHPAPCACASENLACQLCWRLLRWRGLLLQRGNGPGRETGDVTHAAKQTHTATPRPMRPRIFRRRRDTAETSRLMKRNTQRSGHARSRAHAQQQLFICHRAHDACERATPSARAGAHSPPVLPPHAAAASTSNNGGTRARASSGCLQPPSPRHKTHQ